MRSLELRVLEAAVDWLEAGRPVWLCTVLATYGAAPRPPGSLLVVSEGRQRVGSLSGGCVEEDLLERIWSGEFRHPACVLAYGGAGQTGERWGLPCGGEMRVLVQCLPPDAVGQYRAAVARLAARERLTRCVEPDTGATAFSPASSFRPLAIEGGSLIHVLGPQRRLLIVGATSVAEYLAALALTLDYEVVVCDPREDMRRAWGGPDVHLCALMPDDAVRSFAADACSALVALAHDPRLDDLALMEALPGQAFYVGAMGAERSSAARRERLRLLELDPADLDRLVAPVGLAIGSRTPAEIAVAIAADLVRAWAMPQAGGRGTPRVAAAAAGGVCGPAAGLERAEIPAR